jgi:hypothetical protein
VCYYSSFLHQFFSEFDSKSHLLYYCSLDIFAFTSNWELFILYFYIMNLLWIYVYIVNQIYSVVCLKFYVEYNVHSFELLTHNLLLINKICKHVCCICPNTREVFDESIDNTVVKWIAVKVEEMNWKTKSTNHKRKPLIISQSSHLHLYVSTLLWTCLSAALCEAERDFRWIPTFLLMKRKGVHEIYRY